MCGMPSAGESRDSVTELRDYGTELLTGGQPELGEDLAQVVLDCPRADEQLASDLWVRPPRRSQPGDLRLLRGEVELCAHGALAGARGGCPQPSPSAARGRPGGPPPRQGG